MLRYIFQNPRKSKKMTLDLQTYVFEFVDNNGVNESRNAEIITELVRGFKDKEIKLVDLIKSVGHLITSEDDKARAKSLSLISKVLAELPQDQLTSNETSLLYTFFQEKLTDYLTLKETLSSLNALTKMQTSTVDENMKCLILLEEHYDSTKIVAATRFLAFSFLDNISTKYINEINTTENKSSLLIKAFIKIATGEKDPRNLLISFKLNKFIAENIPIADTFKEELFDVVFCYFPITFKPPKNDPYKITSNELKSALRNAISASPIYAEDAFGNLIDRLTATSQIVKCDTLLVLYACITNFGGKVCLDQWLPLWNALKFEILHGSDETSEIGALVPKGVNADDITSGNPYQLSLKVMKALFSTLIDYDLQSFEKAFFHILDELKSNFKYDKNLKQSCNLLASIASINFNAFNIVVRSSLPLFMENTGDLSKLKLIIMNLSFFFQAYVDVFEENNLGHIDNLDEIELFKLKDDILMILSRALTGTSPSEVTLHTLAIVQFTKLIQMKHYLTDDEVSLIIQYMVENILTSSNVNIYCACLEGLKIISEIHPNIFSEVCLTNLLNLVPADPTKGIKLNTEDIERETILKVILDFKTSNCSLIKELIIGLSKKMLETAEFENSTLDCFLLLSSLFSLFHNNFSLFDKDTADSIRSEIETPILQGLFKFDSLNQDQYNLQIISNILFYLNLMIDRENAQEQLSIVFKIFIEEKGVFENANKYIVPFVKLMCAIDKRCDLDSKKELAIKTINILKSVQFSIPDFVRIAYLEFLCLLSNKWLTDEEILSLCDWEDVSFANLSILIWIGKGVSLKSSILAVQFYDHFLPLFSSKEVGLFVAKNFEIFMMDLSSIQKIKNINWINNVNQLYKQKFFSDIFHKLVDLYKNSNEVFIKRNCLTALSFTLKHTSNELVEPYMIDLLPLLLQALSIQESEVKASSLDTIKSTVEKNNKLVVDHFDTIVQLLLKSVAVEKANNVQVRLYSLQILELLTNCVPLPDMLKHKKQILTVTIAPLDDPKRVVRQQAVKTRQSFFELGKDTETEVTTGH